MDFEIDDTLPQKPISKIRALLIDVLGESWYELEDETLSLELGVVFDDILLAKIKFLKVMEDDPERFYEDPIFFLHSCDILNNIPVEPEAVPMPSVLEIAYAFEEVTKLFPHDDGVTDELIKIITYMLQQEGYSNAPYPFSFVNPSDLAPGDTEEETANKQKAVNIYLKYMGEL